MSFACVLRPCFFARERQREREGRERRCSPYSRSEGSFREIFDKAGFRLVRSELQRGFPPEAELLPVKMYALKAKEGV